MGIESGVVERLNAVASVIALTGTRIYANTLANDALPVSVTTSAIVYQLISDVPFDSILGSDPGKYVARIQLTLYAISTTQRVLLSQSVKVALQRFQGAVSDITILDSRIESIHDLNYDQESDTFNQATTLQAAGVSRIMDFIIYYE